MALKSTFLLLCLLSLFILAACTSNVQLSPTVDQKVLATSVAATIAAASTATQGALETLQPATTDTLIPQPSLTETPIPPATSTATLTPTSLPPTPLGLLVAYTKNNDVYLWSPDNAARRLTEVHDVVSVRLSGDGKLIAFKRQNATDSTMQELSVVNTSGTPNPLQLVSANDLAALVPPDAGSSILGYGVLSFAWRPGTHQVAYNTVLLHEGPGFGPNHDLRLVDADTAQKTTLFQTGQGGLFYYSPDGNQIALSSPESISLVNADGSHLRSKVLTYPSVITYSEYEYHPHPIWAEDSASLAVVIPPHDPLADPAPLTALWHIPVDGSPAVLLGSMPAIPFAWPDNAFSPNLALVGYSARAAGADPNQRDLHISAPDGSGDKVYATGVSLEFDSWAPDSQHFLYRIQGGSNEGLYIGEVTGTPKVLIADPHLIRDIKWLDGTRFVYIINKQAQWELHMSNVDATDLALIDTIPDESPDFDLVP